MEKKNWIGVIIAALLGIFGIGAGVKKYNQKKQEKIEDEERREMRLKRKEMELVNNQLELAKMQKEAIEILKSMRVEMGMDPTTIDVKIPDEE